MAYDNEIEVSLDRVAKGVYSSDDLRLLRSAIRRYNGQNAVQLGRYNVRLNQGRNIHIGDRIYRGADAEAIRDVLEDLVEAGGNGEAGVSQGSLRSFGGFIVAAGVIVTMIGLAVFATNFLDVWGAGWAGGKDFRGPSPEIAKGLVTGFGTAFAGGLISMFGNLVRGFERPDRRRR